MQRARCICADIPRLAAQTRITIIRHALETSKHSNTGRIAALALGAQVIEHGAPVFAPPIVLEPTAFLLYPDGAPAATPPPQPVHLVVLDGTWPQSRRMLQRIPALRGLPRLALPPPPATRVRLRRTRGDTQMSTLEAIAHALGFLEDEALAARLFTLHDLFVARSIPETPRH